MRYWRRSSFSTAATVDDIDLSELEDGWEEVSEQDWLQPPAPTGPTGPVITSLTGNNASYSTHPAARRVTIHVISPVGGNMAGRPAINGKKISGTPGGAPYVFDRPGVLTVTTHAGNNDLVVTEEF